MIGDTMETDILGGTQLGMHTVLVLTGGTQPEDLARFAYRPEYVVQSLREFAKVLDANYWQSPWQIAAAPAKRRPVLSA